MNPAVPLRIVGISGSLRSGSYNTALLRAAAELMPSHMAIEFGEIGDVPLYNRDVEVVGVPEPVQRLRHQVAEADAVLFACPQYNRSLTGALKNAVDWLSRNPLSPIDYKPMAIIGGGGRAGGGPAQAHLREVLGHNRVQIYEGSEVIVPMVWEAFDDELRLVDERVWADLRSLISGFEGHVRHDLRNRPAIVLAGADAATIAPYHRAAIADRRVAVALTEADLAGCVARWNPVAVVGVGGDESLRGAAMASGVPFIAADRPEGLAELLEANAV